MLDSAPIWFDMPTSTREGTGIFVTATSAPQANHQYAFPTTTTIPLNQPVQYQHIISSDVKDSIPVVAASQSGPVNYDQIISAIQQMYKIALYNAFITMMVLFAVFFSR